jgi:hypothetical protein
MVDAGEGGGGCTIYTCATTTSPLLTPEAGEAVEKVLATAPKLYDGGVGLIRTVCEPCDMVATVYSWTQGDFHAADLAGFGTPFVSGLTARTGASIIADGGEALARSNLYIPKDANGLPVPLNQRTVHTVDLPLPDPLAGGNPHTTLGGRIGGDGVTYRQSATFPEGNPWPSADGEQVPWSRVDWHDHSRPREHTIPHQHVFRYDPEQRRWTMGGPSTWPSGAPIIPNE